MATIPDRILTTHVGSLIRPAELLPWIAARQEGRPIDQGEFGKTVSWSRYVLERLGGIEHRPGATPLISAIHGKDHRDFAEFYAEYEGAHGAAGLGKSISPTGGWAITGPISYTGHAAIERDIANLKAALGGVSVAGAFLPVVAPASVLPQRKDEHYRTEEEALLAIAEALRVEYTAIVEAGLTVQVDDAFLATTYDVMVPPRSLGDYRRWAAVRVEALNHALRGIPPERSRYHVCWGSWNGPHTNDVAARDIVDLVLRVNVGAYSLEMANPRHEHEWRIWQKTKLPPDRVLLPGVIAHTTNVVEHPRLVAERLVRLAQLVGRGNVIASTDCGFAQGPFGRRVHPTIMWAKLRALAEGAALATSALW